MPVLTAIERLGTLIDETYSVERVLAEGGMGVVFEATHTWTGRRVALKLIKPDLVEPARDARLLIEARAAAALSHPNVVQVLDMGATEDGVSYLVMELLEGRTLKEELLVRGALPADEALAIALPLLGAIAVAHDRGIVHRDIKPANILLSRDSAGRCVPKLLDFGIAKVIEQTGMTRSDAVLGTPHYLSPEQVEGEGEVGPATDIWALGVVLYECLSGKLPFPGDNVAAVLQRVLNQPVPPLRTHAPHVGAALAQAVERALRREPSLRYDDARTFARALLVTALECDVALPDSPDPTGLPHWNDWLNGTAPGAEPTADVTRARSEVTTRPHAPVASTGARSRRVGWAIAAVALAGLLAYALLAQRPAPQTGTPAPASAAVTTVAPPKPRATVPEPQPQPHIEAVTVPIPAAESAPAAPAADPVPKPATAHHTSGRQHARRNPPAVAPEPAPSIRHKLMQSW